MSADTLAEPAASVGRRSRRGLATACKGAAALGSLLVLAGCAVQPQHLASSPSRFDPRLGVSPSERVVFGDDPVPRGGGSYLTGRPYTIAGRTYYPSDRVQGYTAVGTASWYGDAFHGRRTANGEIFDRRSISAAHPTLPLPSYVRVTNLGNGHSMIVRVNDRGPYHGGRVMDVSQRVAEALDFRRSGTAHIRIDYVGRAGLDGSDDEKLMATLRTDGGPADASGFGRAIQVASVPAAPPTPAPAPEPIRVARENRTEKLAATAAGGDPWLPGGRLRLPLPPPRPFDTGSAALRRAAKADELATLLQKR